MNAPSLIGQYAVGLEAGTLCKAMTPICTHDLWSGGWHLLLLSGDGSLLYSLVSPQCDGGLGPHCGARVAVQAARLAFLQGCACAVFCGVWLA